MALNSLQERVEKLKHHQTINLVKTIQELTNNLYNCDNSHNNNKEVWL